MQQKQICSQKKENHLQENIVLKLNDWKKTQKVSNEKYSKEFNKKALSQHWQDLQIKSSEYHISLTCVTQRNEIGIEIYI